MKVLIKKAVSSRYWYADRVGSIETVEDNTRTPTGDFFQVVENGGRTIRKEDAEIVSGIYYILVSAQLVASRPFCSEYYELTYKAIVNNIDTQKTVEHDYREDIESRISEEDLNKKYS